MTFRTHVDASFVRPELSFDVVRIDELPDRSVPSIEGRSPLRWKALLEFLGSKDLPAIVYAMSRADCELLAEAIARATGISCTAYHAGLDGDVRRERERLFLDGEVDVIVATNAFGMGIDKADVRSVIHWQCPASPEALYQEAGRAGRGGEPSKATLLFNEDDLDRAYTTIRRGTPTRDEVRRVEAAIRELADHTGSSLVTISDQDLARLAVLRSDVEPHVPLAHLSRVGLVREIDRLYAARSYTVAQRARDTALSSIEMKVLDALGPPGTTAGLIVEDIAADAGDSAHHVRRAITAMERRGLIVRSRTVSVALLASDGSSAAETVGLCRAAALALWRDLEEHHREQGARRFARGAGRSFGSIPRVVTAAEVLAAFGLVDASWRDEPGGIPSLRLRPRANVERLRQAFSAARALAEVLDVERRTYALEDLAALAGVAPEAVTDGLTALHLSGAASADLRTWQDGVGPTRRIRVLDVPDREAAIEQALTEAAARGRTQRLRLEVLKRYASLEPSEEGDVHQLYLARYLSEPDFLDELARSSAADLLEGLNPEQAEAVLAPPDQTLVLVAGPGTGKTRTLVHRIAHRIRRSEAIPEEILAVTFTRAATEEIRTRFAQLGIRGVQVRTLHAIALQLVRDNWLELGFTSAPELLGEDPERRTLMAEAGSERPQGDLKDFDLRRARCEPTIADHHKAYLQLMKERGQLDFPEALALATRHLDESATALRLTEMTREIFVDEFQDLSAAQTGLVRALCKRVHRHATQAHLTVVGDPRQAIYEWNGADPGPLLQFQRSATARVIDLTKSYRSSTDVLELANATIKPVMPTLAKIAPIEERKGFVTFAATETTSAMYEHVALTVRRWIDEGVPDDEISVLAYRARSVEEAGRALSRHRIPHHEEGLPRISASDAFRVVCERLESFVSSDDEDSTPLREFDELAFDLRVQSDVDEFGDDIERLRAAVDALERDGELTLQGAIRRIQRSDEGPRSSEGVTVTTLHRSKGLEWSAVALTDVSTEGLDGPIPDEERCRLLYVGITRAKTHLDVSWSGTASRWLPNRIPSDAPGDGAPARAARTPRSRTQRQT